MKPRPHPISGPSEANAPLISWWISTPWREQQRTTCIHALLCVFIKFLSKDKAFLNWPSFQALLHGCPSNATVNANLQNSSRLRL